jgi:N-acetylmuramoyl-L-alanine amidase
MTTTITYTVDTRKKLLVDIGHSVKFPGANGVIPEISWNRKVASFLYPILDAKKWNVIKVPTDFLFDFTANTQLIHRINWINKHSTAYDQLLSLHANAANSPMPRGVETCYMGGYESARLDAIKLSQCYAKATGVPLVSDGSFDDRTGRFGRIGMVRDTTPIALLIEMGFCTNKSDMAIDPKLAAQGIADYYNAL